MSTSATFALTGADSSRLCDALDRAAAALATDGRLAGPASAEDGLDDLVPAPDALGVSAELAGGELLVALVVPAVAAAFGAGDAAVTALATILNIAATELDVELGEIVAFDRADDMLVRLNQIQGTAGTRSVLGAGIFEGDAVVATVGAVLPVHAETVAEATAAAPAPRPAGNSAVLERGLQLLADIELTVTAELGRARLPVGELLDLQPGAIIELDREAGVPIDLLVNGTLFARGEVVVVENSFALRVSEIVTDEDGR